MDLAGETSITVAYNTGVVPSRDDAYRRLTNHFTGRVVIFTGMSVYKGEDHWAFLIL